MADGKEQAFARQEQCWSDPDLADLVSRTAPDAYACARAVTDYLTEQCGHRISDAEQACLAICIRRACTY